MPIELRQTRLPGVGTKFTLTLDSGGRLAVILHNDGKREIYFFSRAHDDEPRAVIELDDDEARQVGAVLGGAYERPKIVEELEMALGELLIEWVPVPDNSPWIGKSLAESGFRARTGITVIVAQLAVTNDTISAGRKEDLVAFAGLYVLATATLGVVLMKESKSIGRRLFGPRLVEES